MEDTLITKLKLLKGKIVSEITVNEGEVNICFEDGSLAVIEHNACCQGAALCISLHLREKYTGTII